MSITTWGWGSQGGLVTTLGWGSHPTIPPLQGAVGLATKPRQTTVRLTPQMRANRDEPLPSMVTKHLRPGMQSADTTKRPRVKSTTDLRPAVQSSENAPKPKFKSTKDLRPETQGSKAAPVPRVGATKRLRPEQSSRGAASRPSIRTTVALKPSIKKTESDT